MLCFVRGLQRGGRNRTTDVQSSIRSNAHPFYFFPSVLLGQNGKRKENVEADPATFAKWEDLPISPFGPSLSLSHSVSQVPQMDGMPKVIGIIIITRRSQNRVTVQFSSTLYMLPQSLALSMRFRDENRTQTPYVHRDNHHQNNDSKSPSSVAPHPLHQCLLP
jgi:hypothetical protein